MMSTYLRKLTILFIGVMLVASACSSGETSSAPASASTTESEPASSDAAPSSATAEPSESFEPASFTFTLNFLAGGPQAGFTYAQELGYYEEVGLDVDIVEGQGSATTATQVATGQSEMGFADGPAAMNVRAQGGTVTIVAPVLQTNAFAVISLVESGIEEVGDLAGKTLAVQPGTAQTTLLAPLLEENGLSESDLNIVNLDPSALVGSLLQGEVDAILAGADFQSIQIQDQGGEINEQFYRDNGVPTVGLSIIVNDDYLAENPDVVARFVAASLRGWDAAREDPDAAAQSLVDSFVAADKEQILKQLEVDLEFLCSSGAESLGAPPQENWERTYELLTEYVDLPSDLPITDYYTDEFIPDDAPSC